jgi:SAM-dependent methyltransferase
MSIVGLIKSYRRRRWRDVRRNRLIAGLNLNGLGLEIGASHAPIVPTSAGYKVEIADHSNADELREHFRSDPTVDASNIEEVDYITGGGSIAKIINSPGRYDYIIASHVIEHVPDLFGFLHDCETLLKPDGVLSLAVPDMRYCFDALQSRSTTGMVLQASLNEPHRPSPAAVFDHTANCSEKSNHGVWRRFDPRPLKICNSLADAKAKFDEYVSSDAHTDIHVWRFVPSSFRLIAKDLYDMNLIALREMSFSAPGGFEFFAKFSRDGNSLNDDRQTLAIRAMRETCAIRF